jgi:hypothetical protein
VTPYGEYRTKHLVLAEYDRVAVASLTLETPLTEGESGTYRPTLTPPPAGDPGTRPDRKHDAWSTKYPDAQVASLRSHGSAVIEAYLESVKFRQDQRCGAWAFAGQPVQPAAHAVCRHDNGPRCVTRASHSGSVGARVIRGAWRTPRNR